MALTAGRRLVAGATLAGVMGVGALGVAAVVPLGVAGAGETSTAVSTSEERPGRGEVLAEVLDGLVAEGTIDQTQADRITEAFRAKAQELREQFGRGGAGAHGHRGQALETAAEALGLEPEALKDALKEGQSLAQVAEAQGVDLQVLVDALVAEATARIDAAVADGRLDAAEAQELTDGLADRIRERLENPRERGPRDRARLRSGD